MIEQIKNILKVVFEKFFSKKLFVFLTATALLWFAKISEDIWQLVAITYIGAQAAFDTAVTWKRGNKQSKAEE